MRLTRIAADGAPRHASVVTAVITFCVGLSVLRLAVLYFGQQFTVASAAYGGVLWELQLLITITTLAYLVLRRLEGDFRALFIISLGLFVATESLAALARSYGVIALQNLIVLFNMALFFYSSLCLTAAIADGPKRDLYGRCLRASAAAFIFLSALRTFLEMKGRDSDARADLIMTLALLLIVLYLAAVLIRGEMKARRGDFRGTGVPVSLNASAHAMETHGRDAHATDTPVTDATGARTPP